jgi:CelD/BcsL family acetyltransferase involved in cellulose biosynthesis
VLISEHDAAEALATWPGELDKLAETTGSVFLTSAWLDSWTRAFAPKSRFVLATNGAGRLQAAACVRPTRPYGMASAANLETDDWTVVGDNAEARRAVWQHLAQRARGRLQLVAVPSTPEHADMAYDALSAAGYRVASRPSVDNPRLELPSTWDELLGSVSRNTRSLFRRRLRALGEAGGVRLRMSTREQLDADLACFFRLEGSGWKGRAGTAIASRPGAHALYDRFARAAAEQDWLRLQLLEVDGVAVAADFSCTFAGGVFMVKTAFDESWSRYSPGLVLRGGTLRSAIEDELQFFDFLGPADDYKLRWGATLHPHVTMTAHRGLAAPLAYGWHARLRPRLKIARAKAQATVSELGAALRDRRS